MKTLSMKTTLFNLIAALCLTTGRAATITYQSGTTVVMGPSSTVAGLNVGSVAGNPSSVSNGDLWYNTSTGALMARIGGSNASLLTAAGLTSLSSSGGFGAADSGKLATYDAGGSLRTTSPLYLESGGNVMSLDASTLTDARNLILPDADGTIATQEWTAAEFPSATAIRSGNTFWAGPVDGATESAGFRRIDPDDLSPDNYGTATATGLLHGNMTWSAASLTADVTGTLPVGNGGTGRTSHTAYALLAGGTTSSGAQQSLGTGTSGQLLASGGSAALPTWASGTTINTSSGAITHTINSLGGTTPSAALTLTNTTAAIAGTQQVSPSIILSGNGFATGGGGSIATPWQIWSLPVQGSSNPTSVLKFQTGIGGSYSDGMTLTSGGTLTTTAGIQSGTSVTAAAGAGIQWTGRSIITSPSDGVVRLTNTAATDFSYIQLGGSTTSFPAIKRSGAGVAIRLADDSANAAITVSSVTLSGTLTVPKTVTAGGTTGNQTIDKMSGSVNFAAGSGTAITVTCNLVTTSSIIVATVATNDSTMKSVAVVAGSGSFTIYANAAATAETRVNFIITN